jgi:hypothetical protein
MTTESWDVQLGFSSTNQAYKSIQMNNYSKKIQKQIKFDKCQFQLIPNLTLLLLIDLT